MNEDLVMIGELVSSLLEHANEYEIDTPTCDLLLDAAATILALYFYMNELQEKRDSLDEEEMAEAYYRQEHEWDMDYISGNLLGVIEDGQNQDLIRMKYRLTHDKEFCSRVAYRYRKYLSDIVTTEMEIDSLLCAFRYIERCEKEGGTT